VIATLSPLLTKLRFLSPEFYCCRIGRQLSLGIAPGKGAHPSSPFCAMVSDRIKPSLTVARNSHYRLLQTKPSQNSRRDWLAALIGKQAKDPVTPTMCRLQCILGMSGEMFAVFLFIARDGHLVATGQNSDIGKLAICSLPFLHSATLPLSLPKWKNV
jgi:hypothetical protein